MSKNIYTIIFRHTLKKIKGIFISNRKTATTELNTESIKLGDTLEIKKDGRLYERGFCIQGFDHFPYDYPPIS